MQLRHPFFLLLLLMVTATAEAQQGKGIFFSTFGAGAEHELGDPDNRQAFYVDIPADEQKPLYLRIFDADVGGAYEEKRGPFDTKTRFLLLGGESAAKNYASSFKTPEDLEIFNNGDIVHSREFGNEPKWNATYYNLGEIPKERGFKTEDGYYRFVLLVEGISGNDGNYFDFVISYDPNAKDIPDDIRLFVRDLSLRIPDDHGFETRINVSTKGNEELNIITYDMDDVPLSVEMPFRTSVSLTPSGDGNWVDNNFSVPTPGKTQSIGIKVNGRDFNNTFGLMVEGSTGQSLPIQLPIKDYEPFSQPVITQNHRYEGEQCKTITFNADIENAGTFELENISWSFEDDTLSGRTITRRFDESGVVAYTMSVTGALNGVSTSMDFADSVLINQPPTAWAGSDRIHIPGEPIAFDGTVSSDPDGYIENYYWNFGDNTTGRGARIDHSYDSTGVFTVELRVEDNSDSPCNTARASANVKINEPPIVRLNIPQFIQEGEKVVMDASESFDPDGDITEYSWKIGNDTTLTGKRAEYRFRGNIPPTVALMVTDNSGVENSMVEKRFSVDVNQLPVAIAEAPNQVSPGSSIQFNGQKSYDPDGSIGSFEWDFGNYQTNGQIVNYAFPEPGSYPVVLKVTDDSGISTATDTVNIKVNAPPVPLIAGKHTYASGRVRLSGANSYDPDGMITSMKWAMGDGTNLTGEEVRHTYDSPGLYTVKLSVSDNSETDSSTKSTTTEVMVNHYPEANIEAPDVVAAGQDVRFDGTKSSDKDGEILNYSWDFGDGGKANGAINNHQFSEPGVYQVQLEVRDNSGLEEAVGLDYKEIRVNHPPVIKVEETGDLDPDSVITIDASASHDPDGEITQYYWKYNEDWEEGGPRLDILGAKVADGIKLAVVDNANVDNSRTEKELDVGVNNSPVAIAGEDKKTHRRNIVFDGSESFDPDNDELRYYWDFGDGGSAEGAIVSHYYRDGGRYQAVLTVDDQKLLSNSFSKDTVNVFINRSPDAFFELPYAVCVSDTFRYDGSNSFDVDGNENLRYEWVFGDGNSAQSKVGVHQYADIGTYNVELTVDDTEGLPNSTDSFTHPIRVVGAPQADAGQDIRACEIETVQFDGSNSVASEGFINDYIWDFGDGNTGTGEKPIHRYEEPGTYNVTLTIVGRDYGSCANKATDEMTVTVLPKPEAKFDIPEFLYEEESLTLDASSTLAQDLEVSSFTWEISGVDTISWSQRLYTNQDGRQVAEWVSPASKLTGFEVKDDRSMTGQLPITDLDMPVGSYEVNLRIETRSTQTCQVATHRESIRVRERREFSIAEIPVLAPGMPFTFSLEDDFINTEEYETIEWRFGDGTVKEGAEVEYAYSNPGKYRIQFRADDGRGTRYSVTELEQVVTVNAPPKPVIEGPSRIEPGRTVTFSARSSQDPDGDIVSYKWFFSDGTRAEGPVVERKFNRKGSYSVSLTVTDDADVSNSVQSVNKIVGVAEPPDFTMNLPTELCPNVPIDIPDALSIQPKDSNLVSIQIADREIPYQKAKNHSFSVPGEYRLSIKMEGEATGFSAKRHTIRVNGAPKIFADVPRTITIGAANDFARFDASNTFDPNGDNLKFYWEMGDGTRKMGKEILHEYIQPGNYSVNLKVVDDKGLDCSSSSSQFDVTVEED